MISNFRSQSLIILALALSLFSARAWPISRVGNSSIGDPVDGFKAPLPGLFFSTQNLDQNRLLMRNPIPSFQRVGAPPQQIVANPFALIFPQWTGMNREEFVHALRTSNLPWQKQSTLDDCVEAHFFIGDDEIIGLATWGRGRGVVFMSGLQGPEQQAVREMLSKIELLEGRCGWN